MLSGLRMAPKFPFPLIACKITKIIAHNKHFCAIIFFLINRKSLHHSSRNVVIPDFSVIISSRCDICVKVPAACYNTGPVSQ